MTGIRVADKFSKAPTWSLVVNDTEVRILLSIYGLAKRILTISNFSQRSFTVPQLDHVSKMAWLVSSTL
jgi:hypothetical protein